MHFGCTLGAVSAHFGFTFGSLWVHFGCTLGTLWVHSGCTVILQAYFGCTFGSFECALVALWVHFGSTSGTIRVHFGCTFGALLEHSGLTFGAILGALLVNTFCALLVLLWRLSYPCTFWQIATEFSIPSNRLCEIFHTTLEIISNRYHGLIEFETWTPFFHEMAKTIEDHGSPMSQRPI